MVRACEKGKRLRFPSPPDGEGARRVGVGAFDSSWGDFVNITLSRRYATPSPLKGQGEPNIVKVFDS
jgi:hypothetical protein